MKQRQALYLSKAINSFKNICPTYYSYLGSIIAGKETGEEGKNKYDNILSGFYDNLNIVKVYYTDADYFIAMYDFLKKTNIQLKYSDINLESFLNLNNPFGVFAQLEKEYSGLSITSQSSKQEFLFVKMLLFEVLPKITDKEDVEKIKKNNFDLKDSKLSKHITSCCDFITVALLALDENVLSSLNKNSIDDSEYVDVNERFVNSLDTDRSWYDDVYDEIADTLDEALLASERSMADFLSVIDSYSGIDKPVYNVNMMKGFWQSVGKVWEESNNANFNAMLSYLDQQPTVSISSCCLARIIVYFILALKTCSSPNSGQLRNFVFKNVSQDLLHDTTWNYASDNSFLKYLATMDSFVQNKKNKFNSILKDSGFEEMQQIALDTFSKISTDADGALKDIKEYFKSKPGDADISAYDYLQNIINIIYELTSPFEFQIFDAGTKWTPDFFSSIKKAAMFAGKGLLSEGIMALLVGVKLGDYTLIDIYNKLLFYELLLEASASGDQFDLHDMQQEVLSKNALYPLLRQHAFYSYKQQEFIDSYNIKNLLIKDPGDVTKLWTLEKNCGALYLAIALAKSIYRSKYPNKIFLLDDETELNTLINSLDSTALFVVQGYYLHQYYDKPMYMNFFGDPRSSTGSKYLEQKAILVNTTFFGQRDVDLGTEKTALEFLASSGIVSKEKVKAYILEVDSALQFWLKVGKDKYNAAAEATEEFLDELDWHINTDYIFLGEQAIPFLPIGQPIATIEQAMFADYNYLKEKHVIDTSDNTVRRDKEISFEPEWIDSRISSFLENQDSDVAFYNIGNTTLNFRNSLFNAVRSFLPIAGANKVAFEEAMMAAVMDDVTDNIARFAPSVQTLMKCIGFDPLTIPKITSIIDALIKKLFIMAIEIVQDQINKTQEISTIISVNLLKKEHYYKAQTVTVVIDYICNLLGSVDGATCFTGDSPMFSENRLKSIYADLYDKLKNKELVDFDGELTDSDLDIEDLKKYKELQKYLEDNNLTVEFEIGPTGKLIIKNTSKTTSNEETTGLKIFEVETLDDIHVTEIFEDPGIPGELIETFKEISDNIAATLLIEDEDTYTAVTDFSSYKSEFSKDMERADTNAFSTSEPERTDTNAFSTSSGSIERTGTNVFSTSESMERTGTSVFSTSESERTDTNAFSTSESMERIDITGSDAVSGSSVVGSAAGRSISTEDINIIELSKVIDNADLFSANNEIYHEGIKITLKKN